MATEGIPAELLRAYLRELKPEAQALLMSELERGALSGTGVPGADVILDALRPVLSQSQKVPSRISNPERLFFRPLEPFLIDVVSGRAMSWRVERASLEPLWGWIGRDALPAETATYVRDASAALLANDEAEAERLAEAFRAKAETVIGEWLARGRADERISGRLASQIGTARARDELSTLHGVLLHRVRLADLAAQLPASIKDFRGEHIDSILNLLRRGFVGKPELLPLALLALMSRLTTFWQLVRIAIGAAESDAASRVAHTPLSLAVDIVLAEFGHRIAELRARVNAGEFAQCVRLLRELHDASRGLRTELDLSADSPWARQLASLRATAAHLLQAEIERVPGHVRRLLRPRSLKDLDSASVVDAMEVAEVEGRIELADACWKYAGELAINQLAPRIHAELKNYLDTATPALLDGLRSAGMIERRFRQSQVDAAVRFAGKLHGPDYAALLAKAASVAANERPVAAAKA